MSKPRLLDLFCGAGGCTKGYQQAGFYVVGVDINPQPNYCGDEFIQADALTTLHSAEWWRGGFAAIHASPPCQDYSRAMRHLSKPTPRMIEPVRALLVRTGLPWVIENVDGAPLPRNDDLFGRYGLQLCGTSFGLKVWRHRLFESSFPIDSLACNHKGHAMNPHSVAGRERLYAEFGKCDVEIPWKKEMGVGWMGRYEAREAVPPAFTEYIGAALLEHLKVAA